MSFHKFRGDNIFTGEALLGADKVLICDNKGVIEEIIDEGSAGDNIQKLSGTLTPGFINCHCHLELSHMRGLIPEKTGLINFVFAVVTQRHFADEEILHSIATAETEMLKNGIVAVGDISNNSLTITQKQKQNLFYYNFIETSGWLPAVAQQRFERSKEIFENFCHISPTAIVPHAPYSVSDGLWQLLQPFFQGRVVSIHNQETVFEDELFLRNSGDFVRMYELMKLDTSFFIPSGKSSLQTYFQKLAGAANILLVHNTFTKQQDIDFIKQVRKNAQVCFCLCVNANQYIEQALPAIQMLRKNNCNIVLGTDSLASNWSLSVLDEMKTINKNFPEIPLEELLGWATLNGAKALQIDNSFGSFERGKHPGVVLLENVNALDAATLQLAKARRLL